MAASSSKTSFRVFFLRFLTFFCVLYYGTIGLIGISTPGNYYVPFVAHSLDYVSGLRHLLMRTSRLTMEWMGYPIQFFGSSNIRFVGGRGVHIGYDCIGYGVLSFWFAFILANTATFQRKLKWLTIGVLTIFCINVLRINLLLLAVNSKWTASRDFDSHLWFNICAYSAIFLLIYQYDRRGKSEP